MIGKIQSRELLINYGQRASDITLHPDCNGWCKIYLGVYVHPRMTNGSMWNGVNLKLSGEDRFSFVSGGKYEGGFMELFWKQADLTGKDVIITSPPDYTEHWCHPKTYLEYVRLSPMSEEEIHKHKGRKPQKKELVGWYDPSGLPKYASCMFDKEVHDLTSEECDLAVGRYLAKCALVGIDKLYWRVSCCGFSFAHTKVREAIHLGEEDAGGWIKNNGSLFEKIDVLETAIKYARRFGVKIYAYITLFDGASNGRDFVGKFEKQHPEYQLLSREAATIDLKKLNYEDASVRIQMMDNIACGVLCYAHPEVRQFRLEEIRELISYGPDGIFMDTARSHNHYEPKWPDQFGYNAPIVAEYRKRYEQNILTEDFDRENWWKLQGEYLTTFMEEVRKETNKHNLKLAVAFKPNPGNPHCNGNGRPILGKMHYDYPGWIKEGIIDEIALCNGHYRSGFTDWVTFNEPEFKDLLSGTQVKVYVYTAPERLPGTGEFEDEILAVFQDEVASGISIFEADELDNYNPEYWDVLSSTRLDPYRTGKNADKLAEANVFIKSLE